ncbi:taste receptor type 2 member 9-like [Chroicocephalus ridibundus]|uniref:taste receptor type 2 member 9-like n=1 Tax=Chroicocephalus ridibundus TaxID=1192867 RepID=UPI002FDE4386
MEACYSQGKFNATSYDVMAIVIVSLQTFAGMWINAFMTSVLCIAWLKKKSFNSNEKILLFLGCCRFCFLGITWAYSFLSTIYPRCLYVHPIPQILSAIQSFLNFSNLWVSACLCIFYCLKIANFRNTFFIYLKGKIDRIVSWLLLGSGIFSLVISILVYNSIDEAHSDNFNSTGQGNFWKLNIKMDEHLFPLFFLSGVGFAMAFMAVIFSALLLLFSLWRHKSKMQTNSGKNLSMDAHVKAMKSILSFSFIYSVNFACLILTMIYATKKANPVVFLSLVLQCAFPSVHSLILIFSNQKLKKTLRRTLSCGKCKGCMR